MELSSKITGIFYLILCLVGAGFLYIIQEDDQHSYFIQVIYIIFDGIFSAVYLFHHDFPYIKKLSIVLILQTIQYIILIITSYKTQIDIFLQTPLVNIFILINIMALLIQCIYSIGFLCKSCYNLYYNREPLTPISSSSEYGRITSSSYTFQRSPKDYYSPHELLQSPMPNIYSQRHSYGT